MVPLHNKKHDSLPQVSQSLFTFSALPAEGVLETMFDVMIVEHLHEERMRRMDEIAWERDALNSLQPARRSPLARVRRLAAALLPHGSQQPRRRAPMAS